ncbi:PEP-CTERM sorting domain-containing protein [Microcystis sp. M061S2]|uniref:PEP-CTERM sorting domain-containing protein n=1 Tax=Microcystis sp. M061S2 TaxID=2771171 RepID=UPI0025830B81|nr:PEP-CTERM sorting domain-containing protein [Microcystis sp. M061S2]MCA2654123.1 PEP-CTERM sorting domain-containing protein [Microcystis sp. M061S2]
MKLAVTPLVLSTATFGLMLGVPQNAQASGLIRNVTPSASGFTGTAVGSLAATTNGAGLPGDKPSLTGTHTATSITNSWRTPLLNSPNSVGNVVIEFAFNRIYNLAGFSFWNTNSSTALAQVGIKNVTIEYKLGGGAWTALSGAPTTFGIGTTTATILEQEFNFTPVLATNVRFRNMTNQGGIGGNNRLGFNEIQFRSIPEPSSTLALLALGLAGVGLKKRI